MSRRSLHKPGKTHALLYGPKTDRKIRHWSLMMHEFQVVNDEDSEAPRPTSRFTAKVWRQIDDEQYEPQAEGVDGDSAVLVSVTGIQVIAETVPEPGKTGTPVATVPTQAQPTQPGQTELGQTEPETAKVAETEAKILEIEAKEPQTEAAAATPAASTEEVVPAPSEEVIPAPSEEVIKAPSEEVIPAPSEELVPTEPTESTEPTEPMEPSSNGPIVSEPAASDPIVDVPAESDAVMTDANEPTEPTEPTEPQELADASAEPEKMEVDSQPSV